MSLRESLDDIDIEILRILQEDGRATHADIGRQVSLSSPSVLQRVRKLEELGVIKGYIAVLDAPKVGFELTALVQVQLSLHQDQAIERFKKTIFKFNQVLECQHVTGDFDFLLKVVAEDMRDYEKFITNELSHVSGVARIQTCFVMGSSKSTFRLPL